MCYGHLYWPSYCLSVIMHFLFVQMLPVFSAKYHKVFVIAVLVISSVAGLWNLKEQMVS